MEFILDCPLSPSRGTHPGVQPVLFHWIKLIFTIPSDNNFENVSCLGVGIFAHLPFPVIRYCFILICLGLVYAVTVFVNLYASSTFLSRRWSFHGAI